VKARGAKHHQEFFTDLQNLANRVTTQ